MKSICRLYGKNWNICYRKSDTSFFQKTPLFYGGKPRIRFLSQQRRKSHTLPFLIHTKIFIHTLSLVTTRLFFFPIVHFYTLTISFVAHNASSFLFDPANNRAAISAATISSRISGLLFPYSITIFLSSFIALTLLSFI